MKQPLLIALITLAFLVACRAAPVGPSPATPPTTAAPTTAPTAPTAEAAPTSTTAPATESPPADQSPTTDAPPALFDIDPADRSVYAGGLVAAERATLDALPGAPVYHMAFEIDSSMTALDGRQTVTFTNQEDVALEEVYFHLHANTLGGNISVMDVTVDGSPVAAETRGDTLRVPLAAPLAAGETATIAMRFQTAIPTDIGRNYGVLAYYDDILALAHFYPMLAVYDDEGWNTAAPDVQGDLTYSDAAFYLARVTAPAGTTLVGSGAIIAQEEDGDKQSITFALGPARDFYLAAGDFTLISDTVGETTINSYAPARLNDGAAVALDVAAEALAQFNERLAPYPYTELDIVTTPTSALGIEYPGLIVGTLRMYDLDAETGGGTPFLAVLESTTAHEVAHQWFYNLTGNDQLDEPWLDEAVVSYLTYRYYAGRYGQGAGDGYFQTLYGRWDRVGRDDIPVGLPVSAYEGAEYGAIVYGRGAIFVRELEETVGREAFDAFLRDYVARFRWEEGTTAGFRALAEEHCACDLGPLFAAWIYE